MRRVWIFIVAGLAILGASAGRAAASESTLEASRASGSQVLVLLRLPPPHAGSAAGGDDSYGEGQGRAGLHRLAVRLAHDNGLTLITDWPMPLLGLDCFIMGVPAGRSPDEVATRLSGQSTVAWAQAMHLYHGQGARLTHNDPLYRVQPASQAWRLADLHQMATGRGVSVAVIDSMIDRSHPDLVGQVQTSANFIGSAADAPEMHGTGVAGVIAAHADNALGIAGVAPGARLMALRACRQAAGPDGGGTNCDSLSLAEALHFAIDHKAQVINLSLSGPDDRLLGRLVDIAVARGITVVGAFDEALPQGGFPASHVGVVPVAEESVEGGAPGLYTAPGRDVPTTEPGGRWFLVNGSSYAAAHVSGLFALMREHPARAGRSVVVANGGRIDTCATLIKAAGPCDCACAHGADDVAVARR